MEETRLQQKTAIFKNVRFYAGLRGFFAFLKIVIFRGKNREEKQRGKIFVYTIYFKV